MERVAAAEALAGKHVALYFSAHWCPPCRAFTPVLREVYETVSQRAGGDWAVLFVSGDRDEQQFEARRGGGSSRLWACAGAACGEASPLWQLSRAPPHPCSAPGLLPRDAVAGGAL